MIDREEFKEDYAEGDSVRIYTKTDIIDGTIEKIRSTTIKILMLDGKQRAVSYDDITQYGDIPEEESISAVQPQAPQPAAAPTEATAEMREQEEVLAEWKRILTEAEWSRPEILSFDQLKKRLKKGIKSGSYPEEDGRELMRLLDKYQNAVKVHEDHAGSDRMHDIIALAKRGLRESAEQNALLLAFLGGVYVHIGKGVSAANYFRRGKEYESALAAAIQTGDKALVSLCAAEMVLEKPALPALAYLRKNSSGEQWAIYVQALKDIKKYPEADRKDLIDFITASLLEKGALLSFADEKQRYTDTAVQNLLKTTENYADDQSLLEKVQLEKEKQQIEEKELKKKADNRHTGTIIYWNDKFNYGFIRSADFPHNIYFYIRQIYSRKLRMQSKKDGVNVSFVIGRLMKGTHIGAPAADHIEPLEQNPNTKDLTGSASRHQGKIVFYNRFAEYGGYGKILDDDGLSYTFQRRNVIDGKLIAYLSQSGDSDMDWPVEYSFISREGKRQVSDIISLQGIDDVTDRDLDSILKQDEKKKWEEYQKKNSDNSEPQFEESEELSFVPDYEPLPPYQEDNPVENRTNLPASVASRYQAKQKKLEGQVGDDIFANLSPDSAKVPANGTRNFYAQGHRYMLSKQSDSAKEYFKKAIEANDNISSAVSDLLSIYISEGKQTGTYQDAFSLMKNYENYLSPEKRTNQWITLYAASKADDEELIRYYREAIDLTSFLNRKLQYTKCIAELQQRHEKHTEALVSCNEWLQYAKRATTPLTGERYSIMKIQCLSLYGLEKYEEAQKLAKELNQVYSGDDTIKQIAAGHTDIELHTKESNFQSVTIKAFDELPEFLRNAVENTSIDNIANTRYVTDTQIKRKPSFKNIQEEYRSLGNKSRFLSDDETAKWSFLKAKYIRNYLMWRSSELGTESDDDELTEREMLNNVKKALDSLIRYQLSLMQPSRETVRYFCRLLIDVTMAIDVNGGVEKRTQKDILYLCGAYLATYFYDVDTLKAAFRDSKRINIKINAIRELNPEVEFNPDDFRTGFYELVYELSNLPFQYTENTLNDIMSWLEWNGYELLHGADPFDRTEEEIKQGNDTLDEAIVQKIQSFHEKQAKAEKILESKMDFQSKEFIQRLLDALQVMPETKEDAKLNDAVIEILKTAGKVQDEKSFTSRTTEIQSVMDKTKHLREQIIDVPTAYSYMKLQPVLNQLEQWSIDRYHELYTEATMPELKIELLEAHTANNRTTAVYRISNLTGRQTADNPQISINVGDQFKPVENKALSPIGGEAQEIQLDLIPCNEQGAEDIPSFDWEIEVAYQYKVYDETQNTLATKDAKKNTNGSTSLKDQLFHLIPNPFEGLTQGGPVPLDRAADMVFGRDEEIEEILAKLQDTEKRLIPQRSLALYGQKRSGKTTLLNCVKEEIGRRFPDAIRIDLGSMGAFPHDDNRTFIASLQGKIITCLQGIVDDDDNLYAVLEENGDRLDIDAIIQSPQHTLIFDKEMRSFARCLKQVHPKAQLILFLDEFTYLYNYIREKSLTGDVLQYWKAFMQEYNCSCVIVGQDSMEQLKNEFPNEMGTIKLQRVHYLREQYTRDMLFKPLQKTEAGRQVHIEEGAYQQLYEYSAGSAYWHIILCSYLVNYLNANSIYHVTRQLVRNMVDEELQSGDNVSLTLFEPLYNDSEENKDDNLKIMRKIAAQCTPAHSSVSLQELTFDGWSADRVRNLVKALVHRMVLEEKNGQYRIIVGLFQQFLRYKYGGR